MKRAIWRTRFAPALSVIAAACLLAPAPARAQAQTNPAAEPGPNSLAPVVVTGRRTMSRLEDTPQRIEVIDSRDIAHTPARELTDLLKKNSSVDVIQYPGNLSGIGIRGFRPEFSGINQRTLLLVDGRPAMSTNLSLLNMDQLTRVEVLKGPASALYGSQAMGGVVNLITRESRGPLQGSADLSLGSFDGKEVKARLGGGLNDTFDFDYSGSWIDQGDFTMGNGELRPNTAYQQQNHALRLGVNLNTDWRLNAKVDTYQGRDIATPGDYAYGLQDQSNKDMNRTGYDMRLTGKWREHRLSFTAFTGSQWYKLTRKTSRIAAEQKFLPYQSFEEDLYWRGLQAQDVWDWSPNASLVWGVDSEKASSVTRSYNANGTRKGPFSADNTRQTMGVYAENTWQLNDDATTLHVGLRNDRIRVETLATPFKTGFTPTAARFSSTNPSAGFKHLVGAGVRLHGTVGQGFVVPSASELTGEATTLVAGKTEITRGNPNLKPESSLTWDLGAEWSSGPFFVDATVFSTKVRDRITRDAGVLINPTTRVFSYRNANSAHMQGLELEGRWQINPTWRLSVAGTQFFHARQQTSSGWEAVNNVAKRTVRLAVDAQQGPWSARLGARYVGRTHDQDWVSGSGKQVQYAGYAVWDLSARYRIGQKQTVALAVDNLFDRFYAEKFGFPQPGLSIKATYHHDF